MIREPPYSADNKQPDQSRPEITYKAFGLSLEPQNKRFLIALFIHVNQKNIRYGFSEPDSQCAGGHPGNSVVRPRILKQIV
jgi:hypothetical protein